MSDGETFTRPGVKDVRSGEPGIGHLRHPGPCEPVFLAAPPQRAPPQVGHMVAEGHKGTAVRWHRMISKVAVDHLRQPAPLDGDRLMHAPPQRVLDPPQGRPQAVGATLPLELEGAPAGSPADVGEPQEAERLRFAEPALGAPVRREAAKRDQAGLVRWSTPARLFTAFPIDRRELAEHAALGLTEARVRGAIRTLEEVGFLDRAVASGSTHKPTPDGLHRKPVLFLFGSDYGPLFGAANRRAAAARERRSGSRRGPARPRSGGRLRGSQRLGH